MRYRLLAVLVAGLALGQTGLAGSARAETPAAIFAKARAPGTADAIADEGFVTIGGVKQWVSVRGRHRDNPILLFLHGGPAFTVSPVSYYYMRDWEEYFTVVQWDQRGAGKTFAANRADQGPPLTVGLLVDDAEALVAHLRETYKADRIVLMGHSFGTILGVELAQRRPEWLHAYVGMGQFVNFQRSEALGYSQTLADARRAGDAQAVKELLEIAPFPDPQHPERNLRNLGKERRWLATYGGYYKAGGVGHHGAIASLGPDYTADELRARDEAQTFSDEALWGELGGVDLTGRTRFSTPVVILQGRADRGTASSLVETWFSQVKAPSKSLVWFEDSAHMVYEEEPGKLLVTLVTRVLPLAKPAAGKPNVRP